jgi:hypothetical protein
MMKIFTDTTKWDDKWFRNLSPTLKLVYLYVCDKSDHAGIWEYDPELLALHTKIDLLDETGWLQALSPKVIKLGNGKWWIKNYITFQYSKGINKRHKYFVPVYKSLVKNGIDPNQFEQAVLPLDVGDQKESYQDVISEWNKICVDLPKVQKMTDSRRTLVKNAIKDGVAFQSLFKLVADSDFLSGRKTDFKASFDWVLAPRNRQKIIEGNYDGTENRRPDTADRHEQGF